MSKFKSITAALLILAASALPSFAEKIVPYPPYFDTTSDGASSYQGSGNVQESKYFPKHDFYNMKSSGSLTMITGFPTYQQTTETSCGPAVVLPLLYYFGNKKYDEQMLSILLGTKSKPGPGTEMGTSTSGIVKFFNDIKWKVRSSLDRGKKEKLDFKDHDEFKAFALKNLKAGVPIIVENMYWGGHWRIIIGYDTMGTGKTTDDVLIFADPYDVLDHEQDGYTVENAEGFFYTWKDLEFLPKNESIQQWVTAHP